MKSSSRESAQRALARYRALLRPPRVQPIVAATGLAFALAVWAAPASAAASNEDCLECHDYIEDETVTFPDGTSIDIYVDADAWAASAHGDRLDCTDCHRSISDYPHPTPRAASAREYQLELDTECNRCHYAYFTRVLDGIHFAALEDGNVEAPMCIDCHGAHDTMNPASSRIEVDRRCARCHADIAAEYEVSVHGMALLEDGNEDVPVCTDCHGAHAIADPTDPDFHLNEHTICVRCHGDAERMARYDLNPNVVTTYLEDFHGASNQLYSLGLGTPESPLANCADCHGVHDIQRFDHSGTAEAVQARVADMCRECHDDIPDAFADAWLSHYEPTLKSAPLVWGIRVAYQIMIPLIVLGLVTHILLDLLRVRTRPYE